MSLHKQGSNPRLLVKDKRIFTTYYNPLALKWAYGHDVVLRIHSSHFFIKIMQKDGLQVIDCIIKPTIPITAIEQQLCKVDLLNREEHTLGTWGKEMSLLKSKCVWPIFCRLLV